MCTTVQALKEQDSLQMGVLIVDEQILVCSKVLLSWLQSANILTAGS